MRRQRFRQRRLGETSPAPSGAQGPEGLLPPDGPARPEDPSSTTAASGSPSRRATAANAPLEKYNGKNRAYSRRSTVPKVNSTVRSAESRPGPSSAAIEITVPWLWLASTTNPGVSATRSASRGPSVFDTMAACSASRIASSGTVRSA